MKILPKKSLGQNFLTDINIINKIIDIGDINKKDDILEVGPGTGNLTKEIINKKPKNIFLIEKDKLLYRNLKKEITELAETHLSTHSAKAATRLTDLLDEDGTTPHSNIRLAAAN